MNADSSPPWTAEETKKVIEALKIVRNHNFRIEGTPLPTEVFFAWIKTFYAIAIEVIITSEAKPGMIYLIQRPENDPFYESLWHTPGSILLPGEKIFNAALRVVKKEVGINAVPKTLRFIYHFDNTDSPRGHEPAMLFHANLPQSKEVKTEHGNWFSVNRPPQLVPFHYKLIAKFQNAVP